MRFILSILMTPFALVFLIFFAVAMAWAFSYEILGKE